MFSFDAFFYDLLPYHDQFKGSCFDDHTLKGHGEKKRQLIVSKISAFDKLKIMMLL